MPRKNRCASESGIYHFINRGVIRRKLFHSEEDYRYYLKLMQEYSQLLGVQIYHYCLMDNHTHILLKAPEIERLSHFGHFLQRRYAYYYCKTYSWSEQVFRKRYLSIPVDKDSYLMECGRYIERNPVRAKLVEDPIDYGYSSYAFYSIGQENSLITPNPLYGEMGVSHIERMAAYREYVRVSRVYDNIVDKALVPF